MPLQQPCHMYCVYDSMTATKSGVIIKLEQLYLYQPKTAAIRKHATPSCAGTLYPQRHQQKIIPVPALLEKRQCAGSFPIQ